MRSFPSHNTMFSLVSYNIHSGIGLDGKYDLDRIASVIRRSGADIACLQEVEVNLTELRPRKWSHPHSDRQPDVIAQAAGLPYFSFSASISAFVEDDGSCCGCRGEVLVRDREKQTGYGNAILSRYPILDARFRHFDFRREPLSDTHIYMEEEEQPRCAMAVLVDVAEVPELQSSNRNFTACCPQPVQGAGRRDRERGSQAVTIAEAPVWVVNTHLSHRACSEEQRRQALQVLDWVDRLFGESQSSPVRPGIVLAGDLNAPSFLPRSSYSIIAGDERWKDLWKDKGTSCCSSTFPSFLHGLAGAQIDHIFAFDSMLASRIQCDEIRVLSSSRDARASDHLALYAEMRVLE